MNSAPIETERLLLVPANISLLQAALTGPEALSEALSAKVIMPFTEFGAEPMQYALDELRRQPEAEGWWAYFPILKRERLLAGTCGYKGPPDELGTVEIGYEIIPSLRRRGLATEIASGLVQHAWMDASVQIVQAHTLAEENPSVQLLRKMGFQFIQALEDTEDGPIWQWHLWRS